MKHYALIAAAGLALTACSEPAEDTATRDSAMDHGGMDLAAPAETADAAAPLPDDGIAPVVEIADAWIRPHPQGRDVTAAYFTATLAQGDLLDNSSSLLDISLQDFVSEFGDELLDSLNRANPPVYTGQAKAHRQILLAGLKRQLFPAQADVVHAVTELLVDRGERAAIVNGEMGCGKTTVGIATAAVLNAEGYRRTLVLSPPHLVYKWRREIQETVAGAKVWVLNGPDTLVKLIKLREQLGVSPQGQEFFVLGRVRMRMGFHWKPVFVRRRTRHGEVGACPHCGQVITNFDGEPINPVELEAEESRRKCSHCRHRR